MLKNNEQNKLELIEKLHPIITTYLSNIYEPIIEIIRLTLPISTGILIATLSLDISTYKIQILG